MTTLEDKTVDLLNKLEALATQYTPDVIDAAQAAISISAANSLIHGFISLGLAITAWFLFGRLVAYCQKKEHEDRWAMWDLPKIMGIFIGIAVSTAFALISISTLFDIWNWVALFNPKLALAHKILGI